jgi:hypothetical protein
MSNLQELRKQRDELDRLIQDAERAGVTTWEDGINILYNALDDYAREHLLATDETWRKNVVTVFIGEIAVEFGHQDSDHSGHFAVRDCVPAGIRVDFTGGLPVVRVFIALIQAMLPEGNPDHA